VHVAPACTGSGEGSDHFGSYVCSLSLHFCKRLFPGHLDDKDSGKPRSPKLLAKSSVMEASNIKESIPPCLVRVDDSAFKSIVQVVDMWSTLRGRD
jgi:hypothetical protein